MRALLMFLVVLMPSILFADSAAAQNAKFIALENGQSTGWEAELYGFTGPGGMTFGTGRVRIYDGDGNIEYEVRCFWAIDGVDVKIAYVVDEHPVSHTFNKGATNPTGDMDGGVDGLTWENMDYVY